MEKFLRGWQQYEQMLSNQLDYSRSVKQMKQVLHNPDVDALLNDKLTTE